ncbi:hypothetical protein WJX72_008826 [[Myrmecia] bisecta]|uniref:CRAL-TRIO domain-containing protein n=1 Tax=[Myrmecia] bisecta TaxID=41462 RepID=A0AAW1Q4V6_9CHLO
MASGAPSSAGAEGMPSTPSVPSRSSSSSRSVEAAANHAGDMARMREMLRERGITLPEDRFDATNAELMRYAFTAGLTKAKTEHARTAALETAVDGVAQTLHWLTSHRFMTPADLTRWEHIVQWQGKDPQGRPILVIRIGKALRQYKYRGHDLEAIAEAIVSQTEEAVRHKLTNAPGGPDQVVVVMDALGATNLQATKLLVMFQTVAITLNHHYPGRLHRLYLVEAPRIIQWPLQGIKQLLHPATSDKILLCPASDPQLPPGWQQ